MAKRAPIGNPHARQEPNGPADSTHAPSSLPLPGSGDLVQRDGAGVGLADEAVDWLRIAPFIAIHVGCLAVLWVGISALAAWVAVASYLLRAFAVSAFYHRGFSHRAFRTGRATQFAFAALAAAATQRGPLWWAGQHRLHHAHANTSADPHASPRGFWWSHMGWFLCRARYATPLDRVADLARYAELRWLNRFDFAAPAVFAIGMYALGECLQPVFPETSGWQLLVWGYLISTVALMHATFFVNSLAHRVGARRFPTRDGSRDNWWLALLTMGEGWHNNHHRHAAAARLGFYWWQVDFAYLGLKLLELCGLVRDLKPVPAHVLEEGRREGRREASCA